MSKRRVEPEMLVGLSAVFIGVCALFVSLYEAQLMRQEQRAAVVPILELARSYYRSTDEDGVTRWRLKLHAENVGIGPAHVRSFAVSVDGEQHVTWRSAVRALLDTDADIAYGHSTINGRTIPPDRIIEMFDVTDSEVSGKIIGEFSRLDFEACFCSVFDECWTTSYRTFGQAERVEACAVSAESFQE